LTGFSASEPFAIGPGTLERRRMEDSRL